jgi:NADH-quinone oxidoreductase subunit K
MDEATLLQNYLIISGFLFGIGLLGFLVRRNMIVMFLSVEMMLQGISLSFAAWGRFHHNWDGQMMVLFIIVVAGCEAAIALALILVLVQQSQSLDIVHWQQLHEEGQAQFKEPQLTKVAAGQVSWPQLSPAGIEPETDPKAESYRKRT